MQQNQQERNISIEEYIDSRIRMYAEIKTKAEGAIEALMQMKGNLVRKNGDEQKAQTAGEENWNDANGRGEAAAV